MAPRARGHRATGVFGSTFAFTVFLVFLLFTVQVLFGLYARTTVTAVTADLAQEAADLGGVDEVTAAALEDEGRDRLGRYGDDVDFHIAEVDRDGDGVWDTVAVTAEADLPVLLPSRWSFASPTRFTRTMSARIERFQGSP